MIDAGLREKIVLDALGEEATAADLAHRMGAPVQVYAWKKPSQA